MCYSACTIGIHNNSCAGKTVAMFYLILRFLAERPTQPLAFVNNEKVYLFYRQNVYECPTTCIPNLPRTRDDRYASLIVFVNQDTTSFDLSNDLLRGSVIVQATSSPRENLRWTRQRMPVLVTIPLFNHQELVQA